MSARDPAFPARRVRRRASGGLVLATLFTTAAAVAALTTAFDFSSSPEAFVPDAGATVWIWGTPPPALAHPDNGAVWGSGTEEAYLKDADSTLTSPLLSLPVPNDYTLVLEHAFDTDVATGDCAGELESTPSSDEECGDGGVVVALLNDDRSQVIAPEGDYPGLVAMDGTAQPAFSGTSGGYLRSAFDLLAVDAPISRLGFRFLSNSRRTSTGLGWFLRQVSIYEGDLIPPRLSTDLPAESSSDVQVPFVVEVAASDNRGIAEVNLHYAVEGGPPVTVPMLPAASPGRFQAEIPSQAPDTVVTFFHTAADASGNLARLPLEDEAPLTVRFQLPAPTLSLKATPEVATSLELEWALEAADHYVTSGYEIEHTRTNPGGDATVETWWEASDDLDGGVVVVPAQGYPSTDSYRLRVLFDLQDDPLAPGGWSNPVSHQLRVPRLVSVAPSEVYAGTSATLQIIGSGTTFVQGDSRVSLGFQPGLLDCRVVDVTRCDITVRLQADVRPGPATVTVSTLDTSVESDSLLVVRPASELPRLVSISPDRVVQRTENTIKFFGAYTDFISNGVAVELGTGIVADPPLLDAERGATEFTVHVKVADWAETGARSVTVVSGTQTFIIDLEVEPRELTEPPGCSTRPVGPGGEGRLPSLILWIGTLLLLRVRYAPEGRVNRGEHATKTLQILWSESRHGVGPASGPGPVHDLPSGDPACGRA